ncbi:hypothetical protein, partial [Pasteurella atlantica]|uniref:hypothetical protein n=1 Tax=Pasteurellaceae TaxID=712 RepID=UPI002775677C
YDNDGDGTFDNSAIREFDDKGNIIKYTKDTGLTISYVRDDKGNIAEQDFDSNGDGKNDIHYIFEYNAKELLIKASMDTNNDGKIDRIDMREYDDKGNRIKMEYDNNNDGTIDAVRYFEYDDMGLNTVMKYDTDNDGSINQTDIYGYNDIGTRISITRDLSSSTEPLDGNADILLIYGDGVKVSGDNMAGMRNINLYKDDISLTISEQALDKIATDENSHKVIVNSKKSGDQLHLDGNFTKTTETEAHDGQDYVKYTDEAGNALIVDPDITVDII